MPNRKKWIRYVLYAVEILLLFLLQDTPGLLPQIMGVKPLPVLSAALTIAMVEACTPAMAFGMGLCSGITRSRSACCAFC